MKKYIFMAMTALAMTFGFTGCDDSDVDPGGTATQGMSGTWDVEFIGVDDNNNDVIDFGSGTIRTYNTAANIPTEMWLDDNGTFRNLKFKIDANQPNKTFTATTRDYDEAGTGKVTLTDGKILPNAARNLHGMPNDSIVFYIDLSDATDYYNQYHFSKFKVTGQRYTGFTE